jgi:hypothetical protein
VIRIGLLALVLCACTDPMHPRTYPRWVVADSAEITWRDCAGLRAFVRKSGKEGMGVAVEIRSRKDCPATIVRAELVLDDGARAAATIPAVPELHGRSLRYLWMPIHFDGDDAWNRGVRSARLDLELAIDGVIQPVIGWPITELWTGPYL